MSFPSFLATIEGIEKTSDFNDWDAFLASIASLEDINLFKTFCFTQTKHATFFIKQYSWEIFDALCYWLLGDSVDASSVADINNIINFLSSNIRPRELYIMTIEKLLGCTSIPLLEVLLFSLQLAVVAANTVDILNSG
jgi:hypothetical protein